MEHWGWGEVGEGSFILPVIPLPPFIYVQLPGSCRSTWSPHERKQPQGSNTAVYCTSTLLTKVLGLMYRYQDQGQREENCKHDCTYRVLHTLCILLIVRPNHIPAKYLSSYRENCLSIAAAYVHVHLYISFPTIKFCKIISALKTHAVTLYDDEDDVTQNDNVPSPWLDVLFCCCASISGHSGSQIPLIS